MNRKSLTLAVLLFIVCAVCGYSVDPFALDVAAKANLPLAHSSDLFTLGGSAEINGRFSLPFASFLFVDGSLRYDVNPSRAERSLSLIGLGADVGVVVSPLAWLTLKAYCGVGGFLGFYEDILSGGPYFTAGTGAFFRLFPAMSLGIAASYNHYLEKGSTLYQGVGASLGVVLHIAAVLQRQDIEIQQIEIKPIFPIFQKYYDNHPLGRISIVNKNREAIQDVQVSFFVHNNYMDTAKICGTIPLLKPSEQAAIDLFAIFSDRVLGITEATKVPADIRIEYTAANGKRETTRTETIRLYDRNAMTWDDDRRAAAFVTLKDPAVLRFSKQVAGMVRDQANGMVNENLRIAMGLFDAMSLYGMKYVVDPKTPHADLSLSESTVDFLQFPRQSLEYRAGDCDDLSILYCALLESVGIDTAFITVPGHIYVAVSLGVKPEEAKKSFAFAGELIFIDDMTWVPVEVTMMGESFLKAWQMGAKQWRENADGGTGALLPMVGSWQVFEPVGLPGEVPEMALPPLKTIQDRYVAELTGFVERELNPQVQRLEEQIRQDHESPLHINALGVLYARYGLLDRAAEAFQEALSVKEYVPAIVNLGNLYFLKKEHRRSLEYFTRAAQLEPHNPSVLLGISRIEFDRENYATARDYYAQLHEVSPDLAKRFSYLGSQDSGEARAASTSIREVIVWSEK